MERNQQNETPVTTTTSITMKELTITAVEEINKLHDELNNLAVSALERALRIGELLCREKEKIRHGEWLPWLKANISFSERTANNYMTLFRNRERLKSANVADLAEAYLMLSDRTDNRLPPAEDARKPQMSYAEAIKLEGQIKRNLEQFFEDLVFLRDYDALYPDAKPTLRERLGEGSVPLLMLDKIDALAQARVPREAAARELTRLALQLSLNSVAPGLGDETFADDPECVTDAHSSGEG